jgi:hypothetical protein
MIIGCSKTILILVKHFEKQNMISEDELKKYYLDETGKYIPKLKKIKKKY